MKTIVCVILALFLPRLAWASAIDEAHLTRARDELRRALRDEPKFIKVHAAEALLELGIGEDIRGVFEEERRLHETESPYRIGIWRVLARTAKTPAERQAFVDKIVAAYADPKSPDAVGAVETLAKLEYVVPEHDRAALVKWTEAFHDESRAFGRWLLAVPGKPDDVRRLAELLRDPHRPTRGAAGYGLRFLGSSKFPAGVADALVDAANAAAAAAGDRDDAQAYLASAAFATTPSRLRRNSYRERLAQLVRTGTKAGKYEALNAFADAGEPTDVATVFAALRDDADPDVRVSAARALLLIDRRSRDGNGK